MKQITTFLIFLFAVNSLSAKKFVSTTKLDNQKVIFETISNSLEGNFINFKINEAVDFGYVDIGDIPGFRQYSAVFRNKSCWMIPSVGDEISSIPIETQFLVIDRGKSNYLMLIPLVDNKTRCSLGGTKNGELGLVFETGDSTLLVNEFLGMYLLSGTNPQQMIKKASSEIQQELKTFKLRSEKKEPWFVDYFGWCTWNALYTNLSKDTLIYAMKNFRQKEIPVRYMIIDGGWQSNKERLLSSFDADKTKFSEGIAATISTLKSDFGLDKVFMWQALWGMFQGLDGEYFKDNSNTVSFLPPKRMNYLLQGNKGMIEQEATVGPGFYPGFLGNNIVIPKNFITFYNDYFDYLRRSGADGVKVDAMTWIETTGNSTGGRVKAMKNMMQGLQGNANIHFNNEMINCSSCSNDYLFNSLTANVTRSSGDFFPKTPESHGLHIYTNAHTSFWMGEIVLPDWDMFQSGHDAGEFHAAARAISGGPVYTTEEIGTENKKVLDKLMTSKGKLLRCKDVGRVCTESLFTDPADNKKAVKIYNTNLVGGIVGAFNCSFNPHNSITVSEEIKATDIENIKGEQFAVYSFQNKELYTVPRKESIVVKLKELTFDLFTYVPVQDGFAPIGVVEKYNPGGMITGFEKLTDDLISLKLLQGGLFVAWSTKKPSMVFVNSNPVKYKFKENKLEIDVSDVEDVVVTIRF